MEKNGKEKTSFLLKTEDLVWSETFPDIYLFMKSENLKTKSEKLANFS